MPGSLTSLFGDPDDYEAALRRVGVIGLLTTGRGQFRARLTWIALHRLELAAGEEELSRIAFVAVPDDAILVVLAIGGRPPPVWGGVETAPGDIVTIGPGERLHALTRQPSRWGAVQVAQRDLVESGRALTGAALVVPHGIARWRPGRSDKRELDHLYRAAIRSAQSRSGALADPEAAHGLEQQLLDALVACLLPPPVFEETPAEVRQRGVLARFEDLIEIGRLSRLGDIAAALAVSERLLRSHCETHLGMGPSSYRRRRALQQVNRALRGGDPQTSTVSEIARRYGFRDLGRFAGYYRAVYGKLPSETLRRGWSPGLPGPRFAPAAC